MLTQNGCQYSPTDEALQIMKPDPWVGMQVGVDNIQEVFQQSKEALEQYSKERLKLAKQVRPSCLNLKSNLIMMTANQAFS